MPQSRSLDDCCFIVGLAESNFVGAVGRAGARFEGALEVVDGATALGAGTALGTGTELPAGREDGSGAGSVRGGSFSTIPGVVRPRLYQ